MSTTKKDTVIEALETYLESHVDSEAAKLMLYANPNGSGLLVDKQPSSGDKLTYKDLLKSKVNSLNSTGVFDPKGLQLPIASLGIESRMRHTIDELLTRIEIANLMRAHLYVAHTKGVEWPIKPIIEIPNMQKTSHVIKIPTIKAIKAAAKDALVNQLPTIIGICYTAKYKSSITFSYNLAETKFYTLNAEFLKKSLQWIGTKFHLLSVTTVDGIENVSSTSEIALDSSMFTSELGGRDDNAREKLMFDEWYSYSYNKSKDSHSYPPSYEKLARAITSRIGKILFLAASDEEFNEDQLSYSKQCLRTLGFSDLIFNDKKKELQIKVFDKILSAVRNAYNSASTHVVGSHDHTIIIQRQIKEVINLLFTMTGGLGIEHALVGLDVFNTNKAFYSKRDFLNVYEALSKTGICNERIINAIYKFISTSSLLSMDNSRKLIDPSIELVLARSGDLSKFKTENIDEPSVVFSQVALSVMPAEQRVRFENLRDSKGSTGYVQKGVMSITASLKEDKDNAAVPDGFSPDNVRLVANFFDEMANIYALHAAPTFEERKKVTKAEESTLKLMKKHGITSKGGVASPQYPSFVPSSISPPQLANSSSFFTESTSAPSHVHQEHHRASTPVQMVAPTGLFGNAPSSPSQVGGSSLFGAAPSSPSQVGGSSLFAPAPSSPSQVGGSSLFGAAPSSPSQVGGSSLFGAVPSQANSPSQESRRSLF